MLGVTEAPLRDAHSRLACNRGGQTFLARWRGRTTLVCIVAEVLHLGREHEQVGRKDCISHRREQWHRPGYGKRFVAEGAYVYITGRRQSSLDDAVKEIGSNVTGVQGDVAKLDDLDRLYEQIKREKGRMDVVFANAGAGEFSRAGQLHGKHFDNTFNTNVNGLVFTV